MFRKIAIALVAASALTVPVLAQQTNPSGDSKLSPSTSTPTVTAPEKTEKAVTKPTKHHAAARHHRHAKMAKSTKYHGAKTAKYAKYGKSARHMGRIKSAPKHAYGAAAGKAISGKPAAKSSLKPAAKPGLD